MTAKYSEADLCRDFAAWAAGRGAVAYPEVADWDLVLVARDANYSFLGGYIAPHQLGIQAKLCGNLAVLRQVLKNNSKTRRPMYCAVLVDHAGTDFMTVAESLGIAVFFRTRYRTSRFPRCRPAGGELFGCLDGRMRDAKPENYRLEAFRPLDLPPVVPDLPAGVPSPRSLTTWRVKALALCRILRQRGYLLPEDFKREKVDRRVWLRKWVLPATTCGSCAGLGQVGINHDIPCLGCGGAPKRYLAMPGAELPDVGWESVSKQIEEAR